jgi:hypothetical protein
MTRRASTVKKFQNALYIDYGNAFKNNTRKNYSSIPRLERCYSHLGMDILNLTKRDFIHLIESGKRVTGLCLVSANLQFDSPASPQFSVFPYRLLHLRLTNQNTTEIISVGITGITNNNRLLHNENINFIVRDAATALKLIMPPLGKTDIKILLYNDWPHKLGPILSTPGIDFDLVIAATTQPQHLNTIIELKETLVFFSDI